MLTYQKFLAPFQTSSTLYGKNYVWGKATNLKGLLGKKPVTIPASWAFVETNGTTSAALRSDNKLFVWGTNTYGQLGLGNTTFRSHPIQVGNSSWISIGVGASFMTGVLADGKLFAWGSNLGGQLGQNDRVDRSSPVQIGSSSWNAVGAGKSYAIAIRSDGTLWGWGDNWTGQLGDGTVVTRSSPVQIGSDTNWSKVFFDASTVSGAAIRTDGSLWVWGYNGYGQLGQNDRVSRSLPVQVGSSSWVYVCADDDYKLAISADGKLFTWGNNVYGNLGDGTTIARSSPVQIGSSSWTHATTSANQYALAIRSDGTLWAWGNTSTAIDKKRGTSRSSPVQLDTGTVTWKKISSGSQGTIVNCGISSDDKLYSWGSSEATIGRWTVIPTTIDIVDNQIIETITEPDQLDTSEYKTTSIGRSTALAIRTNNTLWGWGDNSAGALGSIITGINSWTIISAQDADDGGSASELAIRSDGTLWTWGQEMPRLYNFTAQEYELSGGKYISSPVQIGTDTDWSKISRRCPSYYTNGIGGVIKTDGSLWVFGYGLMGNNEPNLTYNELVKFDNNSWTMIAGTISYAMAIRADGSLWAWGSNDYGQLGDGTIVTRSSPVQIGTSSWSFVDTVYNNAVAITTTGTLFAWGNNDEGQLGQNDLVSRSSPVQVATGVAEAYVTYYSVYGDRWIMFRKTDGTVWSMGTNYNWGQLGHNDKINKSSPVQVGSATNWTAITVSSQIATLLNSSGEVYRVGCWYDGTNNVYRSSPVQVGTDATITDVVSSASGGCYVKHTNSLWSYFGMGNLGTGERYHPFTTAFGNIPLVILSSPVQIGSSSWTQVSVGLAHSLAIKPDGSLWAWGSNTSGQLHKTFDAGSATPAKIGSDSWSQVLAVSDSSFGIKTDGTLWAWGSNSSGLLGINRMGSPYMISDMKQLPGSWSSISGSASHISAIRTDGKLFTWGDNTKGRLGFDSISKVQDIATSKATFTSKGFLLIDSSNKLKGTGLGEIVPMNDSPFIYYDEFTQIGTSSWAQVSAGTNHALGIKADGTMWAWGYDVQNQYAGPRVETYLEVDSSLLIKPDESLWCSGIYYTTGSYPPFLLDSVTNHPPTQLDGKWSDISEESTCKFAIKTDGTLWAWSNNNYGCLGTGDIQRRSSPVQIGVGYSWDSIVTFGYVTHAIRSDKKLFAWGLNGNGELGDGTVNSRSSPVQIGTSSWSQVASRIGIKADGTMWVWGQNSDGHLGLNDTEYRSSPTQIGTSSWSQVATRPGLAIRSDGALFAWGPNYMGQVGDGTVVDRSSPVQIGSSSWTQIGLDYTSNISLGIKLDGTLWAWGYLSPNMRRSSPVQIGSASNWTKITKRYAKNSNNEWYYIGESAARYPEYLMGNSSPIQIGSSSWNFVVADNNRSFAIRSDGTLWGWGYDSYGGYVFGNAAATGSTPGQCAAGSFVFVASHGLNTYAIKTDGTLWGWGENYYKQLLTTLTEPGTKSWSQITTGSSHTLAIRSDGTLWGWGFNNYGQATGNGDTANQSSPVQIDSDTTWSKISAGRSHSVALKTTGELYTWGRNVAGQLGIGNRSDQYYLTQVGSSSWIAISAGDLHTMAIRTDGRLFGWGLGTDGRIGDGTAISRSSPVQVGTSSWTQVAAGFIHTAAVRSGGSLFAWGRATGGALGANNATSRSSPVQVGTSSWTQVATGRSFTVAIRSGGSLFSWGYNNVGQLGQNVVTSRSSPVQIGSSSWTQCCAGESHAAAIRSGGSLFAWGLNTSGQVGDGTATTRSSPVQIGSSSWTMVCARGVNITSGIKTDSLLFMWGTNGQGQLGQINTTTYSSPVVVTAPDTEVYDTSSPVQLGSDNNWSMVAGIGYRSVAALKTNGTLWCWGENVAGEIGDNSVIMRSSPVQVAGSWTSIGRCMSHTHVIATKTDGTLWMWGYAGANWSPLYRSSPVQIGTATSYKTVFQSIGSMYIVTDTNDKLLVGGPTNLPGQIGSVSVPAVVSSPVQVGSSSWTSVSAGEEHTMLVKTDGKMWATGSNASGQLGYPFLSTAYSWTQVPSYYALRSDNKLFTMHDASPTQVSAFSSMDLTNSKIGSSLYYQTFVIDSLSRLWGFGNNTYGELGDGTTVTPTSPIQVSGSWAQVVSRGNYTFAIKSDGTLWNWGNKMWSLNPNALFGSWTSISAGQGNLFAIRSDGMLFAGGINGYGHLCFGDSAVRYYLTQVGNSSWTFAKSSNLFSLLIRSDGALFACGYNSYGQLGQNDTINRSSPVQIGTSSWTQVAGGSAFALGIKTDGTLWSWGFNDYGQLGQNDVVPRSSPVQIGAGTNWSKVAAGNYTAYAIKTDGSMWAWGMGYYDGELGLNITSDEAYRSSPVQIGSSSWTQVAAGGGNAAAIRTDGKLFTWGRGYEGEIGDGGTESRSSPVQIGSSSWTQVSVGYQGMVAKRTDGTVWAWGDNGTGSLGLYASYYTVSSPVQVSIGPYSSFVAVSTGHSCGVFLNSDYKIFNGGVHLRNNSTNYNRFAGQTTEIGINLFTPMQIGSASDWSKIHVDTLCFGLIGIKTNGEMYGLGENKNGHLSIGGDSAFTCEKIITTNGTTFFRKSDGKLYALNYSYGTVPFSPVRCFWNDDFKTYGLWEDWQNKTMLYLNGSTDVANIVKNNTSQDMYYTHAFMLKTDGTLWAQGSNLYGQLGFPDMRYDNALPGWLQLPGSWSQISSGNVHTVGIKSDGSLWVMGNNNRGQLGDGTVVARSSPTQIGTSSWSQVCSNGDASYAIDITGRLFSWGWNVYGGLGYNNTISRSSPSQVGTDTNWSKFPVPFAANGGYWMHVQKTDGTLWGMGYNNYGQLGDGTVTNRSSPVQVGSSSWTQISTAQYNCVGRINNAIYSWGYNNVGQLGDGTVNSKSSPVQIGSSSWTFVAAADGASFFIEATTSNVYACGSASVTLSAVNVSSPVQLGTYAASYMKVPMKLNSSSWSNVAVGGGHSVGIKSDGTLWTWGYNNIGQLGDNTITNKISPIQLAGSWTSIAVGESGTYAIKADGTLWAWGENNGGQLGDGTVVNRSSPVQIGSDNDWSFLGENTNSVIKVAKTNGLLWAVGGNHNLNGWVSSSSKSSPVQVGNNMLPYVSSPVQVGTYEFTKLVAKDKNTMAFQSDNSLWMWGDNVSGKIATSDVAVTSPITVASGQWNSGDLVDKVIAVINKGVTTCD